MSHPHASSQPQGKQESILKKTITEAELRRLVSEGVTHREIAASLGRHHVSIAAACSVLGIVAQTWDQQHRGRHDFASYLQDLQSGMTLSEIGKKHGLKANTVHAALKSRGLPTCARQILKANAQVNASQAA